MIRLKCEGSFKNTENFLNKGKNIAITARLEQYGRECVAALASATPVDTGLTADSWGYEITRTRNSFTISLNNSNVNDGVPIAIILQYGHGTRNGGYVVGRDYINPAVQPIFDRITSELWKEVLN